MKSCRSSFDDHFYFKYFPEAQMATEKGVLSKNGLKVTDELTHSCMH